jgi:hypothetical protein
MLVDSDLVFHENKMNNLEWISTSRVYTDEQNELLIDLTSAGLEKLRFLSDSLAHASPE